MNQQEAFNLRDRIELAGWAGDLLAIENEHGEDGNYRVVISTSSRIVARVTSWKEAAEVLRQVTH